MPKKLIVPMLLMSLLFMLAACGGEQTPEADTAQAEETEEIAPAGVPVEVAKVTSGEISLVYRYNGNLEAKDDINIIPGAAGKVEQVLVEAGDFVSKGEVIAVVDDDIYQAQLKQAQAVVKNAQLQLAKMTLGSRPEQIATAQAAVELARAAIDDTATIDDDERTRAAGQLAQTQAALKQAQAEYDKIAWAGDVGQSPQALGLEQATIAYENALASYKLNTKVGDAILAPMMVQLAQAELNLALSLQPFREIDFEIAKAGIDQAKIGVELAQLALDETTIEAPFDGLIADLFIAEGSTVSPQTPIARYLSQEMEVEINVEESRIGQVQPGQFAAIRVPSFPGKDFPALVTSVSPVANKDTRTFSVKVAPQDDEGVLRSGMFAAVSLLVEEKDDTILTPLTSINLTENDEQVVYVINEENKAEVRVVTTGISDSEQVEILDGLKTGDTVVVVGQRNLSENALVEVVNEG